MKRNLIDIKKCELTQSIFSGRGVQPKLLKIVARTGAKTPSFSDLAEKIYIILDNEDKIFTQLVNFPFCVLNENCSDHIVFEQNVKGEKLASCKECRYDKICRGFPAGYFKKYGTNEVEPVADLPREVMIEVEARCNFSCNFCYNHNSFARNGRNIKGSDTGQVIKIIDGIARAGVKIVRFTGGEPLIRPDIFRLFKYAKKRGLSVWLNTNGSLVNRDNIIQFKNLINNVLIPIESWSVEREDNITGYKNSLVKKIEAIKLFREIGIPILRVGTVATKENIVNFNRLAKLILDLPIDEWEFYRPVSSAKHPEDIARDDLEKLVGKILALRKTSDKKISIANAMPFCAIKDPNKLNAVSSGALFEDGHNRFAIDPRGYAKPHYFLDKNIGDPYHILSAWNHPFMKKMRNLKFLPEECKDCALKYKCRGGSRHEATSHFGKYNAPDPLSDFKNQIIAATKDKHK